MRISISVGDYAQTPYYIKGLDIQVYCIEELCVCIKENAFLIDSDFMCDELVDWIDSKCNLHALAKQLKLMVKRQGLLSLFVTMIFEYVGLYDQNETDNLAQTLKRTKGLSSIEKYKEKVDLLMQNKKYASALRGYDMLLAKWDENDNSSDKLPAPAVKAAILHNKGVALASMMQYDDAAGCFDEAYMLTGEQVHQQAFLAAKRMALDENEYVAFASNLPESYSATLKLESTMDSLKRAWTMHADYQRLYARKLLREGRDRQKYYDDNYRLTQALKDGYREIFRG